MFILDHFTFYPIAHFNLYAKVITLVGQHRAATKKNQLFSLDILDKNDENTWIKNSNYFVIGRLVPDVFDDLPLNTSTKNLNTLFMPRHILGSNQIAAIKNTMSKVRKIYGC